MIRQGLQLTKEKPPDTDLENNVVYFTTVEPSTTKEGKIYSDLCGRLPTTSNREKKYIYVMYVYDCNAILTTATKNRSENEMIRDFTSLTEDLKIRGFHPGFHFMDKEASTDLKLNMKTIHINHQLVPPINHRAKNADREIQTFKNHFIEGLCSVEKYFNLQLLDRLLHQAKISLNLLRQSRPLPTSQPILTSSENFISTAYLYPHLVQE